MRKRFIKDCKRILSATVCAVTAAVFAMAGAGEVSAEGAAQLTVSAVEGYAGDTVTVSVALENNPGIAGTAFQLEYDTSVLELVGVVMDPETEDVANSIWTGPTMKDDTPGIVTYANAKEKNVTKSGNLFEVEFKIADGADIGESALTLGGRLEFVNADEQDIEITPVNGKVTVACKHTDTTDTTTDATCTADGKVVTACNICGKEVSVTPIPAKGHTFGDIQTVAEPTCTADGKGVKTCTVCNVTEDVVIPAKGHTFGDMVVVLEPTDTEAGKGVKTCTVCNVTEDVVIPAKGQEITEPSTDEKQPTEDKTPADDPTNDSKDNNPTTDNAKPTNNSDSNKPTTGKNESANGKVQTGDNAGTTVAVLFLVCAVSGAAAVVVYKKKAVR